MLMLILVVHFFFFPAPTLLEAHDEAHQQREGVERELLFSSGVGTTVLEGSSSFVLLGDPIPVSEDFFSFPSSKIVSFQWRNSLVGDNKY